MDATTILQLIVIVAGPFAIWLGVREIIRDCRELRNRRR